MKTLKTNLNWLSTIIYQQITAFVERLGIAEQTEFSPYFPIQEPEWLTTFGEVLAEEEMGNAYSQIVSELDESARLLVTLALAAHIDPMRLEVFAEAEANLQRPIPAFGGLRDTKSKKFVPTAQTALFLLSADALEAKMEGFQYLDITHELYQKKLLIHPEHLEAPLRLTPEYIQLFTTGKSYQPEYSSAFPAQKMVCKHTWDDLVLEEHTAQELQHIKAWLKQQQHLMKYPHLAKEVNGFRALFHGPSGTGKSLTASLLGQEVGMEVYRIDLSKVVSKYIGETEKNLRHIFEQAEHRDWILFFDEGDALFGKRSGTKSAQDRYANQETAYLLQQIEEHTGVVILATNFRSNIDRAFLRRFQAEVYFPTPSAATRLKLWEKAFAHNFRLAEQIDLKALANNYELTGGTVKNVKHYCAVMALERQSELVLEVELINGLKRELQKEGKTL